MDCLPLKLIPVLRMRLFSSTLCLFLLLGFVSVLKAASISKPVLSKHPVTLVISYDGFRYDYMNKTNTPNLDKVRRSGASVPFMRNQYLTNTFPNHHSISTGLYIESHGIVANYFWDRHYSKFLSGYKNEAGFWNVSSEILPLWAANELSGDGRVSGVMMWPGCSEGWGPQNTSATYVKTYDRKYPYEQRVRDVVSWITNGEKPANLVFLYFDEPDSTGHQFGPEGPEMIQAIQRMDNITGLILEELESYGILEDVNLLFLSDHGMQEILPQKYIPHFSFIQNENSSLFRTFGASPTLQILPNNENDTMMIYNAFKNFSHQHGFTVHLTSDLRTEKPHWHYSNMQRVMPILVVGKLGNVFEDYSKRAWNHSTGVHGFDNTNTLNMFPYFMARGPLFKQGFEAEPFENIDIYPFLSKAMQLSRHHHSNGSYERMLPLVKDEIRRKLFPDTGHRAVLGVIAASCFILFMGLLIGIRKFCCRKKMQNVGVAVINMK